MSIIPLCFHCFSLTVCRLSFLHFIWVSSYFLYSAMSDKVSAALDDYRIQVAQRMFGIETEEQPTDDNAQQA